MTWFRLLDEAYLETAFSGEGARRYGGRWNSPGVSMLYAAQSLSLAQLELLVHLEAEDVLRGHWRFITDGEGPWPAEAPTTPTLWMLTGPT